MTRYKKFIRFVCYLFIFTILCSCGPKTPEEIQRDYHTFLDRLFTSYVSQDSLTLHYTLSNPENYGITNSTPSLGKYTVKQMKKDLSAAENYKKKLESFPYEILSREDKITYDILYDSLTKTIQFGDYLYFSQVLGPTTGFQAQLPILLAEYTLKDKQDIEQYLTLLSKVKEYFQMICKFEEEKAQRGYFMSDTTAEQIILQCSSYIKSPENNFLITEFERRLKTLDFLTEKECAAYIQKNHELVTSNIIPSYQLIVTTLSNLKGSSPNKNGLCDYENGKNYYELKVQQITGSNKSIPEMKAMLTKALNYNLAQMTSLCIKDPTLTSAYSTLTFPYTDPEEIMCYLIQSIKKDFPEVSSVNYTIKYVPDSLKEYLSPAMYLIPPLDDYQNNYIYINPSSSYDLTKIFPTVAHEGYPGHLYQHVYFCSQNLHPIRNMLNVTGYDEGWATYVEAYSYTLAQLGESLASFLASNMISIHCLYSLTDIGIHYDGWDKEETATFWAKYIPSINDISPIYDAILAEPGVYLPYSIGYLEISNLKSIAKTQLQQNFSNYDFHKFLLSIGPAPFSIIEKYMKKDLLGITN